MLSKYPKDNFISKGPVLTSMSPATLIFVKSEIEICKLVMLKSISPKSLISSARVVNSACSGLSKLIDKSMLPSNALEEAKLLKNLSAGVSSIGCTSIGS